MQLNPHLAFNGQCEAAFNFYAKCLGGKIETMMTYSDSPMAEQFGAAMRGNVIHATVAFGAQRLTGGDVPPDSYQKPQGFSVLLNLDDAADADRIFKALAENGVVQMPVQETFWALRFGMCVDQFAIPWMINCGKPA